MGEGAGDFGIELVEASKDFGDAVGGEGIVGPPFGWHGLRKPGHSLSPLRGSLGPEFRGPTTCAVGRILSLLRGFRGQWSPRHTSAFLAAGAGGLAGRASARHEGNILAETSVTTGMIDSTDIPR